MSAIGPGDELTLMERAIMAGARAGAAWKQIRDNPLSSLAWDAERRAKSESQKAASLLGAVCVKARQLGITVKSSVVL